MLESLWSRLKRADSIFQHKAHRMPLKRLAAMASPLPRAAENNPALLLATRNGLSHHANEDGVIHRFLGVSAVVGDDMASRIEQKLDPLLVRKPSVV